MIGVHSIRTWTTSPGANHGQRTAPTQASDSQLVLAERFVKTLMTGADAADPRIGERAVGILRQIRARVPALKVPTIAVGPSGVIGMTWEARGHHANLEVFLKRVEYFAEDLDTGTLWSMELIVTDVPPDFLERLKRIAE